MHNIVFAVIFSIILILFGFSLYSARNTFNENEQRTINNLKQGGCVMIEIIEPSSPISSTQYRYKCNSDKFYTLNKDFTSELMQPKVIGK